jgi:hypothetical protein
VDEQGNMLVGSSLSSMVLRHLSPCRHSRLGKGLIMQYSRGFCGIGSPSARLPYRYRGTRLPVCTDVESPYVLGSLLIVGPR